MCHLAERMIYMKNFFKTLAGIGIVAAIAGAIYYVYKNYLQDKEFDDLDDEDWDDEEYYELDDEEEDGRGYVTLDINVAPTETPDEEFFLDETAVEEAQPEETPAE